MQIKIKHIKVETHCTSEKARNNTWKWGRNSKDVKYREANLQQ